MAKLMLSFQQLLFRSKPVGGTIRAHRGKPRLDALGETMRRNPELQSARLGVQPARLPAQVISTDNTGTYRCQVDAVAQGSVVEALAGAKVAHQRRPRVDADAGLNTREPFP